jgi:hypothetical protein
MQSVSRILAFTDMDLSEIAMALVVSMVIRDSIIDVIRKMYDNDIMVI